MTPLDFLVALLPISLAGQGVREARAVWLFGSVGRPDEIAPVLSVAYGLMLSVVGVPGLAWFMRGRHLKFDQFRLWRLEGPDKSR